MSSGPSLVWRMVLVLAVIGLTLEPARGASLVQDRTFTVPIDRSVKNGFGMYSDGSTVLIHLHNKSNDHSRLIDAATGDDWRGEGQRLTQMRRAYDYDTSAEPAGSYLLKMGCGAWRVCTGLEGTSFVVMARQGPSKNLLEFRFVQFDDLFESLEAALSGKPHTAPGTLLPTAQAALEEAAMGSARPRLRDALRSVRTLEQARGLMRSQWIGLLKQTRVLSTVDESGFDLQREVDLAACRAQVLDLKPRLAQGSTDAARELANVLGPACTDQDTFAHVIDWLLESNPDERPRMARAIQSIADAQRNENLLVLGRFLAGVDVALAAGAEPRTERPAARNDSRPDRTRTNERPTTPTNPAPTKAEVVTAPDGNDKLVELARINAVTNQITLLSFSEQGGLTRPDESAMSGTVFKATVVGNEIKAGVFKIEAMNNQNARIRMSRGSYRVPVKAKLIVGRVDRCVSRLHCLTRPAETRTSSQMGESIEFFLMPSNQFRQARVVKFGPLLPPDLEDSSIFRPELTEVRLVIEMTGRIAPN